MTPLLLRQIWAAVSNSSQNLKELSDAEIAQVIAEQTAADLAISEEEAKVMQRYIETRMPLIRGLLENDAFGESQIPAASL